MNKLYILNSFYELSDYLESVVDTVTIRAITVSVDNGIAYAVIVHDSP